MAYERTRRMREIMANLSGAILVEMILTPMHRLRPSRLALCQSCLLNFVLSMKAKKRRHGRPVTRRSQESLGVGVHIEIKCGYRRGSVKHGSS